MLILHFDYPSPASAVALLRVQRVAEDGGSVRFSGIDTLGLDMAVPPTLDQLSAIESWRDRALELGLLMRRPPVRPPTVRAHLVGDLAEEAGLGAAWRSRCLRAYWTDGADIGDAEVLAELAAATGIDRDAALARSGDRAALHAARQRAIAQHRRGIGDVPMLEVDGTLVSAHVDDRQLAELAAL